MARLWNPDPAYSRKVRRIKKVLKSAAADPRHVVALFLDQMGYYRWPSASPDWMADADGLPRAEHDGHDNNQQWRVIDALNACTKSLIAKLTLSGVRECLLSPTGRAICTFEKVYVIQDNWNIHTHDDVQATLKQLPHLEVVRLPMRPG